MKQFLCEFHKSVLEQFRGVDVKIDRRRSIFEIRGRQNNKKKMLKCSNSVLPRYGLNEVRFALAILD